MKSFVTLLKREYWENRGGFLRAPVAVVAFFVGITLLAWIWAEVQVGKTGIQIDNLPIDAFFAKLDPEHQQQIAFGMNFGLVLMALILQSIVSIVVFFYLLGSLYDERRDRSVLFWKSLPVSDTATIASKVLSAAFIAPLIGFATIVVFHLAMLGLASLVLGVHGVNPVKMVWGPAEPLAIWSKLFAAIPIYALWSLPTLGWLMLVSSFARSKPFLWALLPPIVVGVVLTWIDALRAFAIPDTWYWKHVFSRMLFSISPHSWGTDGKSVQIGVNIDRQSQMTDIYSWQTLGNALTNPELWVGAVAGIAMIAIAVHFRRNRELAD
jgi:ABC-2 type transport system permease protein